MSLHLDSKLTTFLEPHLQIARSTFARNQDEHQLVASFLLFLAGKGLVKTCEDDAGKPTWVGSDELYNSQPSLLDLSLLERKDSEAHSDQAPRMTMSLQIIIEQFLEHAGQLKQFNGEITTVDAMLLVLAGQGLAILVPDDEGNQVWRASPTLLGRAGLQMFRELPGVHQRLLKQFRKPRMDTTLKGFTKCMREFAEVSGQTVSPETADIAALWVFEMSGDALAYRGDRGELAWKASPQLLEL